ncbi:tetratricopeptide repeat protein [Oceanicaulis sp. LC35]|uniref:tetratricopeptide repeat protein n=1 Tax=Oceanicaulis sp. LC35 TaxID=3349635 RepID=UPI003F865C99
MPFLFGGHFILAVLCAVHVIRTRQEMYWLLLLFMFPLLGSVVYFLAVMAPDVFGARGVQAASRALDPGRELREARKELAMRRTAGVLKRVAEAHMALGQYEDALALYEEAARSAFADDSGLLQGKASAEFECGRYEAAQETLSELRKAHGAARLPHAHLTYARTLFALGREDEAFAEFEAVSAYFPGAEAKARWAEALDQAGRHDEARAIWREIVETARIIPAHSRKLQSRWINMARSRV